MGDMNPAPLFYAAYIFERCKVWTGVLVIVLPGAICISIYNRLVHSRTRMGEAWSDIDVQPRRRASLVPNLVETAQVDAKLTQPLGRLFTVAENYPQLQASENFQELPRELSDLEEKIAYARLPIRSDADGAVLWRFRQQTSSRK